MNQVLLEVQEEQVGFRLDKFLATLLPEVSRTKLTQLIEEGKISKADKVMSSISVKVKLGEAYSVILDFPKTESTLVPSDIALDIVYEDDDLAVINKPAGLTTHPGVGNHQDTLANALLHHFQTNLSTINGTDRPGIVHRLDKDTTGLLVIAKNDKAHQSLSEQLSTRKLSRVYYAICWGVVKPLTGIITGNIARAKNDRTRMRIVRTGGKEAETKYTTVQVYGEFASLIECRLMTGRTHQIRIHLSNAGHSLLGDQKYGNNKRKVTNCIAAQNPVIGNFKRQALHARLIGFYHPTTNEYLEFEAEIPDDMLELMECLEQFNEE